MHLGSTAIGLVAVMLLGASAPAAALETVTIRDCYDGDTCTTTKGEKIRLACIDTPEMRGRSTGAMVNIDTATEARDHDAIKAMGKAGGLFVRNAIRKALQEQAQQQQ